MLFSFSSNFIDSGVWMIYSTILQISPSAFNGSGVLPLAYSTANSEFYAVKTLSHNVDAMNGSGDIVFVIDVGGAAGLLAYDSVDLDIYVQDVNSNANNSMINQHDEVTDFIPVGQGNTNSYVTFVPSVNGVFLTTGSGIVEINCSSNQDDFVCDAQLRRHSRYNSYRWHTIQHRLRSG